LAKPARGPGLPTNDSTSLSELAALFQANALSALHIAPRDVPPDDSIPLSELHAMFRAAAKNGKVPSEVILSDFLHLRTTWWAKRMISVQQSLAQRLSEAERALRALSEIESFLHPMMMAHKLVGQMPGYNADDTDLLWSFLQVIPRVAAVFSKTPRGSTVAAWHRPAEIVAFHGIIAWRLAGRRLIGIDDASPLGAFTQAWLARACNVHTTTSALAAVFTAGPVRQWAKLPMSAPAKK